MDDPQQPGCSSKKGGGGKEAPRPPPKEVRDAKTSTKITTTTKIKERWLLTRKTWRYMSDAGKKLFPDGINPQKAEDIPKIEEYFQKVNQKTKDFIVWNPSMKRPEESQEYEANFTEYDCGGSGSRERYISIGDVGFNLPLDFYNQLIKNYGVSTLNRVASRLLEEQLMEEDEFEYDEDESEYMEVDGRIMRSVGSQTDPHLDMCVQTDHDDSAEDYVNVGAETRAETEAAVARDRAAMQEQYLKELHEKMDESGMSKPQQQQQLSSLQQMSSQQQQQHQHQVHQLQAQVQLPDFQFKQHSSHQDKPLPPQPNQQDFQHQQQSQPPVLRKFWARRESISKSEVLTFQTIDKKAAPTDKDREGPPSKGGVAARLASLQASSDAPATSTSVTKSEAAKHATEPPKQHIPQPQTVQAPPKPKRIQNEFKMGLKCDLDEMQGLGRRLSDKSQTDKFKTINYDKTLRNIKSKWVANPEEEAFLRQLQLDTDTERERLKELKLRDKERVKVVEKDERLKEKEKIKEKEKKKKKARAIQVGEPLPQFILNSLRINSPVEIIHATRRRFRRLSSKADSISGSESSMSPSGMVSPRFPISVIEDQGTRELLVSEAEAYKLSQMGIPFVFKRPTSELPIDSSEFDPILRDAGGPGGVFPRSMSAIQASGHISQILCNLRAGRFGSIGGRSERSLSQSLLQYLLPAVMNKARSSAGGHSSRLVAKRIWRTRSKSQSRASAGTTSIWTPMENSTWMSVTGRVSTLEPTTLLQITELERLTLQRISQDKLQALNLGCPIRIPKETCTSSSTNKKRRPYLLKRKALSSGFFENRKEDNKLSSGNLVFGVSLSKCLENERLKLRETAEREAIAIAAAGTPSGGEDGEGSLSRKSSQAGSRASFTSLLEGAKQSTTGSLESLNLERKRPSLGGGDLLLSGSPTSLDFLIVEPSQVPALLGTCCRHLEAHGLRTLGIFRVSSSIKRVRQIREEFDSGKDVQLNEDHCPHDVAALIKEFFRDLPEPLLTRELYEPLIHTQKIRNRKLQLEALQYIIQLLPTANRDTLHSLLNFLTMVAENASIPDSDAGNKMDSNNLATIFAPNILHQMKPGTDTLSTAEMTAHAEERLEVINVVRSMIDHNKELFEVSAELLDETYQHLMDSHPEGLDILLQRRCTGPDDRGHQLLPNLMDPNGIRSVSFPTPPLSPSYVQGFELEVDTNSSVFDGSDASSPLPRSPTDHHEFERLRSVVSPEDNEGKRKETTAIPDSFSERNRRRRRRGDEESSRKSYKEKRTSGEVALGEEKSWFRRREKSGSRELERIQSEDSCEKARWFRRRDKTSPKEDKSFVNRQDSEKKSKGKLMMRADVRTRERISSQESVESQNDRRIRVDQGIPPERLRLPEPSVRRLSSPEIENFGVITASLKIPVPLQQQVSSLSFTQETDIPFIEDVNLSEEARYRLRDATTTSRQRTGSNDSYLGQPITGTMSFQPLTKRDGENQSNDSVLSTSSMGVYTMSPSDRNTPNSDFHYASETSSPIWLSPDSGTPGLSPPNSPPTQRRRNKRSGDDPGPSKSSSSLTHTFGFKGHTMQRTNDKSYATRMHQQSSPIPKTADALKIEESAEAGRVHSEVRNREEGNRVARIGFSQTGGGADKDSNKRYTRRKYTGERHHTGHLADVSPRSSSESTTQLWKRWEIIASDPTEPETFV